MIKKNKLNILLTLPIQHKTRLCIRTHTIVDFPRILQDLYKDKSFFQLEYIFWYHITHCIPLIIQLYCDQFLNIPNLRQTFRILFDEKSNFTFVLITGLLGVLWFIWHIYVYKLIYVYIFSVFKMKHISAVFTDLFYLYWNSLE